MSGTLLQRRQANKAEPKPMDNIYAEDDDDQSSPPLSPSNSNKSAPPMKPKHYSEAELAKLIREQLGYDEYNLFTDTEIDIEGFKREKNLKNQVEIQAEIERRREEIADKKKFISFKIKQEEAKSGPKEKGKKVELEEVDHPVLAGVNLSMKRGDFLAVVGPVACGKTSFLMSLMQETSVSKGSISVKGTVAYVEQEPFIMSASVKQNILFGKPFDKAKFEHAIRAS